jgi:hypothetical protein
MYAMLFVMALRRANETGQLTKELKPEKRKKL